MMLIDFMLIFFFGIVSLVAKNTSVLAGILASDAQISLRMSAVCLCIFGSMPFSYGLSRVRG